MRSSGARSGHPTGTGQQVCGPTVQRPNSLNLRGCLGGLPRSLSCAFQGEGYYTAAQGDIRVWGSGFQTPILILWVCPGEEGKWGPHRPGLDRRLPRRCGPGRQRRSEGEGAGSALCECVCAPRVCSRGVCVHTRWGGFQQSPVTTFVNPCHFCLHGPLPP